MPIDPCEDGCLNHNIGANTVPVAGDDPCNSAGNGYYCAGSYWLYDPTAVGADPATDGDCARLFLRTGGDCNVDQWLEIHVAEIRTEAVNPVDGVDCCPPGTLWRNTTDGTHFISTNVAGDCTWCQICIPHNRTATTIPTNTDCGDSNGGYAIGSIWRIPPGTLSAGQQRPIIYHMVNECDWCRICGGGAFGVDNALVPEAVPEATIFKPNINNVIFDIQGEWNAGTDTATMLVPGRYQAHFEAQFRANAAIPFVIVALGVRHNGVITFFPVTMSWNNVANNTTLNLTGASQIYFLGQGDTIEFVVQVFGSGGNLTLESFVVNQADVAVD